MLRLLTILNNLAMNDTDHSGGSAIFPPYQCDAYVHIFTIIHFFFIMKPGENLIKCKTIIQSKIKINFTK